MASITAFLDNVLNGLTNPKGDMGDFSHAARLVIPNWYLYAPKVKFLYHVVFNINPKIQIDIRTIGLLVKEVDLPKYKVTVETVQQYNRKKNVQTKLNYDPIQISFHDDNASLTTMMWNAYYNYYFADQYSGSSSLLPTGLTSPIINSMGAYKRNTYKGATLNSNRYGLDNNSTDPFFTDIQIYQLSRHTYQGFTIVNPIISAWQHDSMTYEEGGGIVGSTMSINYEAVKYTNGIIEPDSPAGFATDYYDSVPSSLSLLGGGTNALLGPNGLLTGATDVLNNIATGGLSSAGGMLANAIKISNMVNNASHLSIAGLQEQGINTLTGIIGGATGAAVSGVANVIIPTSTKPQTNIISTMVDGVQNNGPLAETTATAFFNSRPGSLASLAKTTLFQKSLSTGNANDVNATWNALTTTQQTEWKNKTLSAVIDGDPIVQAQYNIIKEQG